MSYDALLSRTLLRPSQLKLPLSAGGVQTTRLAVKDRGSFYFSTSRNVFHVQVADSDRVRGNQDYAALSSDYLIPCSSPELAVLPVAHHSAHRAEVTAIAVDGDRLASIDSYGACVLTTGLPEGKPSVIVLHPPSVSIGEPGWSGVSLQAGNAASVATARQYYRDVLLFDSGVLARSIYTLSEPAGISFLGAASTIAVLEGADLVLYDLRASQSAACISRKAPASSLLHAVDPSDDGTVVAVAGSDRTAHVFDTRTMSFRERWPSCLKYECAGLRLSRQLGGMVYVCSVDNEVSCGAWSSSVAERIGPGTESLMMSGANTKSSRRLFGFRGDVRLAGMDSHHDNEGEILVTLTESGSVYTMEVKGGVDSMAL